MDPDYNKPLKDSVTKTVNAALQGGRLNDLEKSILNLLLERWDTASVSQISFANLLLSGVYTDSDTRQIREAIRSLRVNHLIPILSDRYGYRLPVDKTGIINFLGRLEGEAKKRAQSSIETYNALKEVLGVTSKVFEQLAAAA